jgi:hypothetical protein
MALQTPYGFKTFYAMRRFLTVLFLWIGLAMQSQAQGHVGFNKVYSFYPDTVMKSTCLVGTIIYDSITNKIFMPLQSIPLPEPLTLLRHEAALVRADINGNIELMKIDTQLNMISTYDDVIVSADGQFLYWGGGGL